MVTFTCWNFYGRNEAFVSVGFRLSGHFHNNTIMQGVIKNVSVGFRLIGHFVFKKLITMPLGVPAVHLLN